jgi:RNA polymerase sigma factor (sigma-70 family)
VPAYRIDAELVDSLARRLLSQPPLQPDRERALARAARAGDRGARDDLVRESLRLVALRALHLGLRGDPLDEAMQSGTLGLIAAVDRFDPDRGTRLATYAWPWITAAIRTTMRPDVPNTWDAIDSATVVDLPDDLRPELAHLPQGLVAVIRLRYRLGELAGPPRSRKDVAMRLGLTVAQVRADEARAMTHLRARLAKVGHRAPRSSTDVGADPL